MLDDAKLDRLRTAITENLRVQRGGARPVPYIDVGKVLVSTRSRQNHAIFARRGCGKTLLLQHIADGLPDASKCVYLNCEDFKKHSFPNVLVEILEALFRELEDNLRGWFGRKKRSRQIIGAIRIRLREMRDRPDLLERDVIAANERRSTSRAVVDASASAWNSSLKANASRSAEAKSAVERQYKEREDKIRELDLWLPELKSKIREFFELSSTVKTVFLEVDDFYHLNRADQPFVMDYVHRLSKDLPIYFKVATLRHASVLYADREGQPIGAQERHDYQPVNIDFSVSDFQRTVKQNRQILNEFGRRARIDESDLDDLFKGEGFHRLVLAGGGVPRDTLSLFLEILDQVWSAGDQRIGKDDVRILSRSNFERRIEELKQDSQGAEQGTLIRGIYVLRQFCIDKGTNIFLVSEQMMQQEDQVRDLLHRLLDYRIVHNAASALTHKSYAGTYQAFAIDIGCYAHMRKLRNRFNELALTGSDANERMRSAPVLDVESLDSLWTSAPADAESALLADEDRPDRVSG